MKRIFDSFWHLGAGSIRQILTFLYSRGGSPLRFQERMEGRESFLKKLLKSLCPKFYFFLKFLFGVLNVKKKFKSKSF